MESTTLQNRKCAVCNKNLDSRDPRKKYCSNACKQVPYRQSKGILPPAFLKPADKTTLKPFKSTTPINKPRQEPILSLVSKEITNPAYQVVADEIGQLEQRLEGLRRKGEANQQTQAAIFIKDETLLDTLDSKAQAVMVLVAASVVGYLVAQNQPNPEKARKAQIIAAIVGLGLAAFIIVANQVSNLDKKGKRKVSKIQALKRDNDLLVIETQKVEAMLAVKRVELIGTPTLIQQTLPVPLPAVSRVKTASELRSMSFDLLNLPDNRISLIGRPERGFAMAVYGAPGQGKSTFALELAYDLALANGKSIYFSAEEGFSQSLQNKIARFQTDHLSFSDHRKLADVAQELHQNQYEVVVLDSVQQLDIGPDELLQLREAHPRTSFIYILQATKEGNFRGDNRFAHDADIQIKLKDHVAVCQKTRYLTTL